MFQDLRRWPWINVRYERKYDDVFSPNSPVLQLIKLRFNKFIQFVWEYIEMWEWELPQFLFLLLWWNALTRTTGGGNTYSGTWSKGAPWKEDQGVRSLKHLLTSHPQSESREPWMNSAAQSRTPLTEGKYALLHRCIKDTLPQACAETHFLGDSSVCEDNNTNPPRNLGPWLTLHVLCVPHTDRNTAVGECPTEKLRRKAKF